MKIAITGHRPEKITNPEATKDGLKSVFLDLKPECVIVGMAAGVDLWAGEIALSLGIPVVAAKPWSSHMSRKGDMKLYNHIIENANQVVNVIESDRFPGAWVYHKRNHWMVDESDLVVAVWDRGETGGTYQCVQYAFTKNKNVLILDPVTTARQEVKALIKPVPPVDLFSASF